MHITMSLALEYCHH